MHGAGVCPATATKNLKKPAQTYAHAVTAAVVAVATKVPQKASFEKAVEEAKKWVGQLCQGDQNDKTPAAT